VDDELVVRDSLGRWFAGEAYEVGLAASGREALAAVQEKHYDVALLDINAPGIDGMEVQ